MKSILGTPGSGTMRQSGSTPEETRVLEEMGRVTGEFLKDLTHGNSLSEIR